MQLYAFTTL